MNALDFIENIYENENIINADLKYCLVNETKHPYKIDNTLAHPNLIEDFVSLEKLLESNDIDKYAGIGISVQASNIFAIDVDKCFLIPFDISSADDRAKAIIEFFKELAYIEFSFSGCGLRILFRQSIINDYTSKYYIKNDKLGIEFYQPNSSYRYVTITGKTICNNPIDSKQNFMKELYEFLDKYMTRPKINNNVAYISNDNRTLDELMKAVKRLYFKDISFQNSWFDTEHKLDKFGQSLESQNDFKLLSYIYENITQDKEKLRLVFEQSDYYKTKDYKHIQKWLKSEHRYYNYVYEHIRRNK